MSKKGSAKVETLQLKPSEATIAINHMIKVNLENAKLGKVRRGLFLWGGPGIAKSSLVKQIAKAMNFVVIDIRLTQMEPTDLRGIPVPTDGANGEVVVQWAIPEMLPRRAEGETTAKIVDKVTGHVYDGAILLLDELPNAAPSVQAGSYQLVLDGQLGEYIVPDNVVVLAAGNRETDKGSTFKMPTPLMNRFTHIEVRPDFEDWQNYALQVEFDKDVIGYLTAFKHELYDFDPQSASKGFATPRSWEAVSDIKRGNPNLPEMVMLGLLSGTVGDGIAVKFMEYTKNAAQLPASDDILDGKIKKLSNKETSLMYALTTAMCYELRARYAELKKDPKNAEKKKWFDASADNFLGFMLENFQSEMIIMGARSALSIYNIRMNPAAMKNWTAFAKDYQALILSA